MDIVKCNVSPSILVTTGKSLEPFCRIQHTITNRYTDRESEKNYVRLQAHGASQERKNTEMSQLKAPPCIL